MKLLPILIALLFNSTVFSQTTYIHAVVHVMYTNASENISDAVVQNYLDDINKGFSRLYPAKFTRIPDIFGNDWANTDIQLCLANIDPNGNTTNGITHTQINNPFQVSQNPNSPENPIWNSDNYLNIYLTPLYPEPGFPNFILGGWASTPTSPQIGSSFNYVLIASNSISFIPELICHEIGHVFGLEHLDNDVLPDTPIGIEGINPSSGYSTSCSLSLQTQNTTTVAEDGNHWGGVDPPNMIENFMGLSFCCQFMFTSNQAMSMQNYINTHLSSWITSSCSAGIEQNQESELIKIYPNPTLSNFTILQNNSDGSFSLELIDQLGKIYETRTEVLYNTEIGIEHLPSGIYTVKIKDTQTESIHYLKLLKN
jgi:hypothetical protein